MSNFIGLTGAGGDKVIVNADHIVTLSATAAGTTFVALTSRTPLYVLEDMYRIVEMSEPLEDWEV